MNVLSLFDGISCGQLALKQIGVNVKNYFSSEIHLPSIRIAHRNFPFTKFLGNVCNVDVNKLPKIDLLLGGSPCQGFSFTGKQLNFEDPRSKLFFEYVRILKTLKKKNPKLVFLLENVPMKKKYEQIITDLLGVEPLDINASLVSAQNRRRLYWTNLRGIEQPKELKVYLADILDPPFKLGVSGVNKKMSSFNNRNVIKDLESSKSFTIVCQGRTNLPSIPVTSTKCRKLSIVEAERLQGLPDNYTFGESPRQRINAIGNGWSVSVIKHILKQIKKK